MMQNKFGKCSCILFVMIFWYTGTVQSRLEQADRISSFSNCIKSSAQHIPVDKSANYIYTNYYSPKNFELRRVKTKIRKIHLRPADLGFLISFLEGQN